MSDDSGNLSIDFIAGFTIFIIAFIWVLSMIPGLLIGLQGFTIDYDAVAYRTGVILVEDPGEPASWEVAEYNKNWNKGDVLRFGLAVSRDDPNILALDKVNRFFDTRTFGYPDDYHNLSIFGDYPYTFNISLRYINSIDNSTIGNITPDGYGYIRRFVKVKGMSNATIDGKNPSTITNYVNGKKFQPDGVTPIDGNETSHIFAILLNNTELVGKGSTIKDPAYQIIPAKESFMINLTNLPSTMWPKRESCFNITLRSGDIWVSDGTSQRNLNYPIVIIDDNPAKILSNTPTTVKDGLTVYYNTTADRKGINWEASRVYLYMKFNLTSMNNECEEPPSAGYPGSRFLHSEFISSVPVNPFSYNYDTKNVTQPQLRDAVVEVAVW